MSQSRRQFIQKSLLLPGVAGLNRSFEEHDEDHTASQEGNRLVLLGTQGGPFIRSFAQTPSANLIVYQNVPYIIDTGYGVTLKLREAGINLATLKYIFITHHHSDHNLELGPLLYNAWIAGLKDPIEVYAPTGLKSLLEHYWESNRFDIDTRIQDEGRADIRKLVISHEISEGTLMTAGDVEISCLKNIHPPVTESFAYRFKLGQKIVAFSGDTTYCPALEKFASNADYLVHEVMYGPAVDEIAKRRPNATKLIASIKSHHTFAEDVGRVATATRAKNLVLTHFVPPDDKSLTDEVWLKAVGSTFQGKIIVGKDLMQLVL